MNSFIQFLSILIISLLHLVYIGGHAQAWEITSFNPIPEPVSNNSVCARFIHDTAFVFSFAGIDTTKIYSGIHNRSYRLNTMTNEWIQIPDLPDPVGKIAAAASRIGDIIYIAGGYHVQSNGHETSSDRMHRYQISTNEYLSDGADIPVPIDDQVQCVWRDSLIYLITGWSNNQNVPDVQIYDPALDAWSVGTPVPDNNLYKAFGASGTIIGDTIYYFGGASHATNFPALKVLRKGAINTDDPSQITWSFSFPEVTDRGYRSACGTVDDQACWIGGSGTSYNYDGIAYNGTGGVSPLKRTLWYDPLSGLSSIDTQNVFPMDLRGLAELSDSVKFIIGGMVANQRVTDGVWRLKYNGSTTSTRFVPMKTLVAEIFPNPATDKVTIDLPFPEASFTIKIYDMLGNLMKEESATNTIYISDWPDGKYIVVLSQQGVVSQGAFIIQ